MNPLPTTAKIAISDSMTMYVIWNGEKAILTLFNDWLYFWSDRAKYSKTTKEEIIRLNVPYNYIQSRYH